MNKDIADKWVAALRSGEYIQGHGCLKEATEDSAKHCCLGVLTELFLRENPDKGGWTEGHLNKRIFRPDFGVDEQGVLPIPVLIWAGMKTTTGTLRRPDGGIDALTEMNDSGRVSFEQLADVIEQRHEEL